MGSQRKNCVLSSSFRIHANHLGTRPKREYECSPTRPIRPSIHHFPLMMLHLVNLLHENVDICIGIENLKLDYNATSPSSL